MPYHTGRIFVLSDAPTSMTKSVCEKMQLQIKGGDYESVSELSKANWDLLIIESVFNIQDAIRKCKRVRAARPFAQIFIVSRHCTDSVIHESLSHGADDHICSPFSEAVFEAKISTAMRRSALMRSVLKDYSLEASTLNPPGYSDALEKPAHAVHPGTDISELFQLELASKKAIVNGVQISLTKSELLILSYLISNFNIPCEKFEMLEKALGYKDECYLTSLYSHINRLRRKFTKENLTNIRIKTIWRYGYKLVID